MRKKKAHSAPPEPRPEPRPEPKYAVITGPSFFDTAKAYPFYDSDAAMRFADSVHGRIFGLNPEYEYEVTRTMRVKP